MKVAVFGANKKEAEKLLKKLKISVVEKDPDFVVSYGGDGTFMRSEQEWPGVPKLALKNSAICKMCSPFSNEKVLKKLKAGRYELRELIKLEARAKSKALVALNDISVHNTDRRHGMRYQLWVDEEQHGDIIIGDGIVVATPFGSTAYYRSITDSFFEVGIGLAFNNSTEQADHIVLDNSRVIKLKVMRGPAVVYADNQPGSIDLAEGDEVMIKKSKLVAKWVIVK